MEQLLDNKTLAAVIAAAPVLPGNRDLAKVILVVLSRDTYDGCVCSELVQNIFISVSAMTSQECSAKTVGSILGSLGFQKRLTREGYRVYWNAEQVAILKNALTSVDDHMANSFAEAFKVIAVHGSAAEPVEASKSANIPLPEPVEGTEVTA